MIYLDMNVWQFLNDNLGFFFLVLLFGGGTAIIVIFEIVFGNLAKAFQSLGGGQLLRRRMKELEDELDEVWAARRADGLAIREWTMQVNAQLGALQAKAIPPPPDVTLDDWPRRDDDQSERRARPYRVVVAAPPKPRPDGARSSRRLRKG